MAFLFDQRRVRPSSLAAELVVPIEDETTLTEVGLKSSSPALRTPSVSSHRAPSSNGNRTAGAPALRNAASGVQLNRAPRTPANPESRDRAAGPAARGDSALPARRERRNHVRATPGRRQAVRAERASSV